MDSLLHFLDTHGPIWVGTQAYRLTICSLCFCIFIFAPSSIHNALFNNTYTARFCKKTIFQALKKCFFRRCSCETQTSPVLPKKNQALKNCFSSTAPAKLRLARLCKKKSGSKKLFFRMSLVKSANSAYLPRFSSLQIAQMHTIHN